MSYLGLEEAVLSKGGASWTAREIEQQPHSWVRTQEMLATHARAIEAFLRPLLARQDLRIILTGAGSSAYIGQCLAPILLRSLNRRIEAIPTTDLVSAPRNYFQKDVPTLLISFGRSGNSPESVAAIDLSRQCVQECYQLVFTCNAEGSLYTSCHGRADSFAILLPDETHDRSFAMTSSFSCMLYAALVVFRGIATYADKVHRIAATGAAVIKAFNWPLRVLAGRDHARVVWLGSSGLAGLASEAALKVLELTDGAVVAVGHSPLGLRHGPKTIVNRDTLVTMFVSNDPLTRRYDLDLLRELRRDSVASPVLAITAVADEAALEGEHLLVPDMSTADDADLMFPFAVCAQLYAFHRSLRVGNSPDEPNASGIVSRVVRGVTIHTL
ncbi:MAG: SIS domain-containing protein [Gammaproteobacteria bacterium]